MRTHCILSLAVVCALATVSVGAMTHFVNSDFTLPHWGSLAPDPECNVSWTVLGPAYDVGCPNWPDNPGSGEMAGHTGLPHTTATLAFGTGTKGAVTDDTRQVQVSWSWMANDDPVAIFSIIGHGHTVLRSCLDPLGRKITLTYGPQNNTFVLAENIDHGAFYRVTLDIDVVEAGVITGTVIKAGPLGDDVFHIASNLPLMRDEDGFDTISAEYLGLDASLPMNWDVFRVDQIPEPATMGLLVVGGLALIRRRRK